MRLVLALTLLGGAGLLAPVRAQELPPAEEPRRKPATTQERRPVDRARTAAAASTTTSPNTAPVAPTSAVLLVLCDLECAMEVDGAPVQTIVANTPSRIELSAGQHFVRAVNAGRGCQWEEVVEARVGQQLVLKVELVPTCRDEVDAVMAQVWLAQEDFTLAGRYIESIPQRDWREASSIDTASLFAAHQTLRAQLAKLAELRPADSSRQRVQEEMVRVAENADRYLELLTKSIQSARDDKGWLGKMFSKGEDSGALQSTLEWSFETWQVLRVSEAFSAALPNARRSQLGLALEPYFDLGVDYYNFRPSLIALVRAGGRAAKAGFKDGDRIEAVDGQPVAAVWEIQQAAVTGPPRSLMVRLERKGSVQTIVLPVPGSAGGGGLE